MLAQAYECQNLLQEAYDVYELPALKNAKVSEEHDQLAVKLGLMSEKEYEKRHNKKGCGAA